jgi:hypothetical protein
MSEQIKEKAREDWKNEFTKQYCYQKLPGETEYVLRPISGDRMLNIIQEIISQALQKRDEAIINLMDTCEKTDYSDTECADTYEEGYEMCLQDIKDAIINSNN